MELADELLGAVGSLDAAAVVFEGTYRPVGGDGTVVMPPTFGVGQNASDEEKRNPYLYEQLYLDVEGAPVDAVVLDQTSSQGNRVEEALLEARDEGRIELPLLEMNVETPRGTIRLTSLDVPHRYADAYWRDSLVDGVRFDKSDVGSRMRSASDDDVRPLYEREPVSLVLGAWDSHRKGRWPRFARAYQSRIIGIDPVLAARKGSRIDPINLTGNVSSKDDAEGEWRFVAEGEKKKGERLSEIGHGNIAPSTAHGGVVVRSIRRNAHASLGLLRRLRFGDASPAAADAARAALLALAIAGDRLAFGQGSIWLRSGCDLLVLDESVGIERRGGDVDRLDVTADEAIAAFHALRDRASEAGIPMASDVVTVEPIPSLREAIEFAVASATSEE